MKFFNLLRRNVGLIISAVFFAVCVFAFYTSSLKKSSEKLDEVIIEKAVTLRKGDKLNDYVFNNDNHLKISKIVGRNDISVIMIAKSSCEACKSQLSSLRESKNNDLNTIIISSDNEESIKIYREALGNEVEWLFDYKNKYTKLLKVSATPLTMIVDRNMNIMHIQSGYIIDPDGKELIVSTLERIRDRRGGRNM